jgi:pimeloyl-ACP methyl ester carboxylesterase
MNCPRVASTAEDGCEPYETMHHVVHGAIRIRAEIHTSLGGGIMLRRFLVIALLAISATFVDAQPSLPSSFQAKTIHSPEAADIFVRWGGKGAVVVLIHGYAENSDSWAPLAADLMKDHTVVVPDLRGIGKSSKPEGGYDKKTQAKDIRAVVTALGYDKTFVVAATKWPAFLSRKYKLRWRCSLAVLEQDGGHPYAVRLRLRFVWKRRLHLDSIEAQTRYPGSPSMNQVRKPKPEWREQRRSEMHLPRPSLF